MSEILSGDATDAQIAAFGVALRAKGETAAELAALVRTMLELRRARRPHRPRGAARRHLWHRRRRRRHRQRVDHGRASSPPPPGRGSPSTAVGRRRRSAGRSTCSSRSASSSTSGPRREPLRARGRHRLLLRPALPSGDALRRAGAPRAGHADHLQLPRPPRQPGGRVAPHRRRLRSGDGRAGDPHVGHPRCRACARLLRARRARRAHRHHHVDRLRARATARCASTTSTPSTSASRGPTSAPSPAATRRATPRRSTRCSRGRRGRSATSSGSTPPPPCSSADVVPDLATGVDLAAELIDDGRAAATLEAFVRVSVAARESGIG